MQRRHSLSAFVSETSNPGSSPRYGNWDKLQHDRSLGSYADFTFFTYNDKHEMKKHEEKVLTDTLKLENATHKHSDIETGRERWRTCSLKLQFLLDKNLHRRTQ